MQSGIRTLTSIDLNQVTTQRLETLGAVGATADGKRFRYVGFGGTVAGGNVLVGPALVNNHQNCAVQAATPAGSTTVPVTLGATAATLDQYAGGQLVVGVDGSGVPISLRIRGNTAANSSGTCYVYLEQTTPTLFALTTSNVVSLSPSIYSGVTASSTAGIPIGVAVTSGASGSYGWVQVYGPVGVVNDAAGALSANGKIKQSTTVAGAVVASSAATDIQIGTVIQGMSASKAGLVLVTLD